MNNVYKYFKAIRVPFVHEGKIYTPTKPSLRKKDKILLEPGGIRSGQEMVAKYSCQATYPTQHLGHHEDLLELVNTAESAVHEEHKEIFLGNQQLLATDTINRIVSKPFPCEPGGTISPVFLKRVLRVIGKKHFLVALSENHLYIYLDDLTWALPIQQESYWGPKIQEKV